MELSSLFWLFIIFISFMPMFNQRRIEGHRLKLMREIEQKRKSRLIAMIHRQESISFLGLPLSRYINIEDSEEILRAIRLTPDDMPIDILLHTPGGLVLAAEQIAHAIMKHPAKVTIFVPHYAMSGGTLLALSADEIIMDENAVLGPVDPQLGNYPAVSILKAVAQKDKNDVDDTTLILADVADKAIKQVEAFVLALLKDKMEPDKALETAKILTGGQWTHDYPITCEEVVKLGIPVKHGMPTEIYELMELYPQPAQRRPSVQYIPIPYQKNDSKP